MKTQKIDFVINSRLKMQSVQRYIENNFGIFIVEVKDLIKFKNKINSLNSKEMSNFIRNLGGPVNINETREFLNNILK